MLRGIEIVGVLVAAENVDGVGADPQARAQDQTLVDGVADRRAGRACALSAHVALGGKAGQ